MMPEIRLSSAPRRFDQGFTLIEVLAVIVILGVLAAMVIPAISSVRARGHAVACMSNLRQVGLGMELYLQENRGYYPEIYGKGTEPTKTWMWKLGPYLDFPENAMGPSPLAKAAGVFVCPDPSFNRKTRNASYAYNVAIDWSPWFYRKSAVPEPRKTFLVVEADVNSDYFSPFATADVSRRHPGHTANFLFVDGHVEALSQTIPATDTRWRWGN
jgi:prepilin-type N-terminal cleavage/methylation domain-containing protein/prepilin-type processing-associated H-X9-DG protein